MPDDPAAAEPDFCSLVDDAPAAAEPDFCSVDEDVEGVDDEEAPLLAGELELALPLALVSLDFCSVEALPPDAALLPFDFCSVEALPPAAALPLADSEGFCSWLIEGDELDGVCCLSCATALSDNIAAATATAIGVNLI